MEESKQANELFGVVKRRVAAGRVACMCRKCHNVLQLPRQLMEGVVSWKHLFWTPWGYILVQNLNCSPLSKGFFLQRLFLLLLFFTAPTINKMLHLWESIRVWGSQNRDSTSCWGIHSSLCFGCFLKGTAEGTRAARLIALHPGMLSQAHCGTRQGKILLHHPWWSSGVGVSSFRSHLNWF